MNETKLGCGMGHMMVNLAIWCKYDWDTVTMSEMTKPGIHAYNVNVVKVRFVHS